MMQSEQLQENLRRPKIHILLATFNRAHLIGETLDSIISQTYTNWECIIVDDFSSDNTKSVIDNYISKDSRFHYYPKTEKHGKGLSVSRNFGLDLAEKRGAEFIQFFDDDDIMHPKKLELQIGPLLLDSDLHLTICCYRKFDRPQMIEYDLTRADDRSCNITTDNLLKSFFLNQINLNSPGPLWRAEILANYRFNEELFYAEEKEFYLRIFLNETLNYAPVQKILFWYRKHDRAITSRLYEDPTEIHRSSTLFHSLFLEEVLQQKSAPYYILKFYAVSAVKAQNQNILRKIVEYISSGKKWTNLKYLQIYLYLRVKQATKLIRHD